MHVLTLKNVNKIYANGIKALKNASLSVREGEVFALLGPNGAGKTTLIGIICGLVQKSSGDITVLGKNLDTHWRHARQNIGLVPQELTLNPFDTVLATLTYQRGFYGKPRNNALIKEILTSLSLWEKRDAKVQELSGGMKRRVLIGKALTNEPKILFLDEPTAGVDVELRKGMWKLVRDLKKRGVTIVLTTHYLEEAELMADRIGIIRDGELGIIDTTRSLLDRFGEKCISFTLKTPLDKIPHSLEKYKLQLADGAQKLVYHYSKGQTQITDLLKDLKKEGIMFTDVDTQASKLEDIFLQLINESSHA